MNDIEERLAKTPKKYHVLLITATVLSLDALTPLEAAQQALLAAPTPGIIDPTALSWVVKHVSDVPIELGEEAPENAPENASESEPAQRPRLVLMKD